MGGGRGCEKAVGVPINKYTLACKQKILRAAFLPVGLVAKGPVKNKVTE